MADELRKALPTRVLFYMEFLGEKVLELLVYVKSKDHIAAIMEVQGYKNLEDSSPMDDMLRRGNSGTA